MKLQACNPLGTPLSLSLSLFLLSTRKSCKDARSEVNRKQEKRRRALTELSAKSPTVGPTAEQKRYARTVKDARSGYR